MTQGGIYGLAGTLLLIGMYVSVAEGAEHHHGEAAVDAPLPDAPEKAVVMEFCTQCHGVERVQHSGGDNATWQDRIQRMVRWGARIPQQHIEAVSAYLAKALPFRPRPPASLSYFANTAVREATVESVQSTLRLAAHEIRDGQLFIRVDPEAATLLKIGQRARVFSIDSRAATTSATITRLIPRGTYYEVIARLVKPLGDPTVPHLVEIVIEHGRFLAIPNDAIIEEDQKSQVYVQNAAGDYLPRTVQLGVQGDQLTQVLAGLSPGERLVSLGSFFIDAEYKLNLPN